MTQTPIRSAATIITVRNINTSPQVLMGQRGSKAAFMPNKFVFPGGAVDAEDSVISLAKPLVQTCHARLLEDNSGPSPESLAVAAIR